MLGGKNGVYRADELVDDTHALVPGGGDTLVDAHRTLGDIIVQRPADNQDEEAHEGRPAKESGRF